MQLAVLTIHFMLPGCASLKEKRHRMGGLHVSLGRNPAIAVCESGNHDAHDRSEWSFVVVAPTRAQLDTLLEDIEARLEKGVDGRITGVERQLL